MADNGVLTVTVIKSPHRTTDADQGDIEPNSREESGSHGTVETPIDGQGDTEPSREVSTSKSS